MSDKNKEAALRYSRQLEVREGRQMMLDIMDAEASKAFEADPPDDEHDRGEGIESCEDRPGPNYEPDPDLDDDYDPDDRLPSAEELFDKEHHPGREPLEFKPWHLVQKETERSAIGYRRDQERLDRETEDRARRFHIERSMLTANPISVLVAVAEVFATDYADKDLRRRILDAAKEAEHQERLEWLQRHEEAVFQTEEVERLADKGQLDGEQRIEKSDVQHISTVVGSYFQRLISGKLKDEDDK